MTFRRGVRLAIDVGRARIGVARSDPDGVLAVPVETVARSSRPHDRIAELVAEYEPIEIVVGLPVNLRGEDTGSTRDARHFARQLSDRLDVSVRLVDERLSTVSAQAAIHASGRKVGGARSIVDQVAAVVLLQHALDIEKSTGKPAGASLGDDRE